MKYNISKELFENVMNFKCDETDLYIDINSIRYCAYEENITRSINIYEFMYKCKEFSKDIGYSIVDGFDTIGEPICYIMKMTGYSRDYYYEQTKDYKNVFDACQCILDNKDLK